VREQLARVAAETIWRPLKAVDLMRPRSASVAALCLRPPLANLVSQRESHVIPANQAGFRNPSMTSPAAEMLPASVAGTGGLRCPDPAFWRRADAPRTRRCARGSSSSWRGPFDLDGERHDLAYRRPAATLFEDGLPAVIHSS
jgi:hypothetical protein